MSTKYTNPMKTAPRLPAHARRKGRPRLATPSERIVLTFRPEEQHEIRRAAETAGYRRLPPFIMDLVRGTPKAQAHVEPPARTTYHVQVIGTDVPMIMQVAVDVWKDGRTVTRYTGIEYPNEAVAREHCAQLNGSPRG